MRTGCKEETARARQAAKWGADRLARERRGREFIELNGLGHNFLTQVRMHKDPPASVLMAMAQFFCMTMEEFVEEAWAQRDLEEEDEDGLIKPKKPPKIAAKILKLFPNAVGSEGNMPMAEELKVLDDLRYQNPVTALNRLFGMVDTLPREQLAYSANIAASCLRMSLHFSESFFCTDLGRNLSDSTRNRLAMGDSYQRLVYLYCDKGYRRAALASSREASEIFAGTMSMQKQGEAILERAYCYEKLKDYEKSLWHYQSAQNFERWLSDRYKLSRIHGEAIAQLVPNPTKLGTQSNENGQ